MWKKAAHQTVHIVCFLLGLALMLQALGRLYAPRKMKKWYGFDEPFARAFVAEPEGTVDVFFVGSSLFYAGVSPMELWENYGITSFDVATGAQRLYRTAIYVDEIIRTQHPKLIVLDGYVALEKMDLDKAVYFEGVRYFPLFFWHNNWRYYDLDDLKTPPVYNRREVRKGYRPLRDVEKVEADGYMEEEEEEDSFVGIRLSNLFYLERIRWQCKLAGVPLMFLTTPSPYNWDDKHCQELQAYADAVGIPNLDMNLLTEELNIDFSVDYRDEGDHLNVTGATKATAYLGDYLMEQFHLVDHRGDEAYWSWEESLPKYHQYMAELKPAKSNGTDEASGSPGGGLEKLPE